MRRFLAVAVGFLVIAASAGAEEMMRPGPSPESGLAGVWRIIGAKSAPWVKAHKLTKADAPLLEYAVEFLDHEVKGPGALACKAATYSSGVAGRGEILDGKLANDTTRAMTKALNLSDPTIFRVICGGAKRDYYIDDNADMVMAEGDVIYTLERPTGMDPEQYTAGFSGPSFDCTQARATGDRLICSDAQLSKVDQKLGAAYFALKKAESAESFASFQSAQRAWLAYVAKSCHANGPMPADVGDKNTITECLTTAYTDRAGLLEGLQVTKSGSLVLEPRIRFRLRAKPDTEESDIYPWLSGGPQAAAFNAFVLKTLRLDAWRMDDKKLFRYGNDVNDMKLHAWRFYSAERFDARVVSLQVGTSDFVGGHDEEHARTSLNWDMARAAPITLGDVFAADPDWKKFVRGYCDAELRKQVADDNMPADLEISHVGSSVANDANWLWGKDKATVMFTIFMNSGMPASPYDVDIPYKALKPYMKPDNAVLAKPPG